MARYRDDISLAAIVGLQYNGEVDWTGKRNTTESRAGMLLTPAGKKKELKTEGELEEIRGAKKGRISGGVGAKPSI